MKLKLYSNIILSIILLIATTGVTINKHYSSGKLFSVSVYTPAEDCCEQSDCHDYCNDTSDLYKISSDFVMSDVECPSAQQIQICIAEPTTLFVIEPTTKNTAFVAENPPPFQSPNIIKLQNFRL